MTVIGPADLLRALSGGGVHSGAGLRGVEPEHWAAVGRCLGYQLAAPEPTAELAAGAGAPAAAAPIAPPAPAPLLARGTAAVPLLRVVAVSSDDGPRSIAPAPDVRPLTLGRINLARPAHSMCSAPLASLNAGAGALRGDISATEGWAA